ncbi:ImmA/IrrE family metallo-endopeptidase [Streptococcus pluranimalium]
MIQRLNVNTEVLSTYIRNSNTPIEYLRQKLPNIDKFLRGELEPTFNQLSALSKLINVPTGLLLLKEPISPGSLNVDFRTFNSELVSDISSELKDTILEMQEKQEFLKELVENDCPFVGIFTFDDDRSEVILKARELLGNEITRKRFDNYRKILSDLGIFIFLNGKYKDNTHRPLNLKEFRGFVLSDRKAPIIFINQLDSKTGQLFTLIHEFVHLLYGDSDLFDGEYSKKRSKTEALINSITAEILVPKELVGDMFDNQIDIRTNLDTLSKKFEVSKFVVLRRLYDLSMVSKKDFTSLQNELEAEFKLIENINKKSNGGNYNNNLRFRMDSNFFNYVSNAVQQNKISYTDAFGIVGVGYKGYKILSRGG